MKTLFYAALAVCILTQSRDASAAKHCLRYEPIVVTLSGTLVKRTYPGAPNYESIKDGDQPETGYYLKLRSPACVKAKEQDDGVDHENIKEVQLVLDAEQYAILRPQIGKPISLAGRIFEGFNGHHNTPVLLIVLKDQHMITIKQ